MKGGQYETFPLFLFSIVCMVATSFNTSRTAHANNDMTPIGFQFYASDNTPYQMKLSNYS